MFSSFLGSFFLFVGYGGVTYYQRFSKVDADVFLPASLLMEGVTQALGVFMTTWIMAFTLFHAEAAATQAAEAAIEAAAAAAAAAAEAVEGVAAAGAAAAGAGDNTPF